MAWADATVWRAVLAAVPTADDRTVRERLWHIHMVQRAFFAIWNGSAQDRSELASFAHLNELATWGLAYHDEVAPYLAALNATSLEAKVHLPWAERLVAILGIEPADPTLRETLLQVVMHSQYHRGQVNMRLRELGIEPPLVDYVAWIWIGRPAQPR